jgi:hypothetical protein
MRAFCVVAALALAGCQSQPVVYDVPGSRTYDLSRAELFQNLITAIEAEGLEIVEADASSGRLSAVLIGYQDNGWAVCKPRRVIDRHDDKSRRGRGRPVDRQLDLIGNVDANSLVDLSVNVSERQINPFKNLSFQVRCPSTGKLERSLLDRIGA